MHRIIIQGRNHQISRTAFQDAGRSLSRWAGLTDAIGTVAAMASLCVVAYGLLVLA